MVPMFPWVAVLGFFCRSQRAGLIGSCNPRDYPEVGAESAPSFLITDHVLGTCSRTVLAISHHPCT